MLALLALACVPAFAQADSAGIEYESEVPTANGGKGSAEKGSSIPQAKSSKSGGTGVTEPESNESSESGSSPSNAAGGKGSGDGKDGGNGQGNQANGSSKQQQGGGNEKAGISQDPVPLETASHETSGGGSSSPLVPILIVIAVLAAISIGAVVIRQRRQRPGSTISPKAS